MKTIYQIGISISAVLLNLFFAQCWTLERIDPPCLEITGFTPSGAPFDSIVTVEGKNFSAGSPELHEIFVGQTRIPDENIIDVPDAQTIRFKVPKGIANGKIMIALKTAPTCEDVLSDATFIYYYTATTANIIAGQLNNTNCSDCLNTPMGLEIKPDGDVYVADRNHHAIQQIKMTQNGSQLIKIAGRIDGMSGWADDLSDGLLARFNAPSDIAVDKSDNIYVADEFNHRIRLIDNSTRRGVSTISGQNAEFVDNVTTINGRYINPTGIAIDPENNKLYVSEFTSHRIRELGLSPSGTVTTIATGSATPSPNGLNFPAGVAFSAAFSKDFDVLVADQGNKIIRGVTNNSNFFNVSENPSSFFSQPYGITLDNAGTVFVTDRGRKEVVAVYPDKQSVTIAGNGNKYTFKNPSGITFDQNKKVIYVSDRETHVVVKIQLE
jgi:DNA-binding beta-propeller fold protein YncE